MGRVRKYKKIKACDPYSKRRGDSSSANYDDPPELFEAVRRKKRMKVLSWDNDDDRERLLQQQAVRELRHSNSSASLPQPKLKVEPIRTGENLRKFNKRVREETTKMLAQQVPRMTASAQRRKEKLKEIQAKKKSGKPIPQDDDDNLVFGSRSDGYIRPSDRNDSADSFREAEGVGFNETADRPPDLASWKDTLASKAAKLVRSKNANKEKSTNSVEVEKIRLQAIEAYKQVREKRKLQAN